MLVIDQKKVFTIKKVKNIVPQTCFMIDLNGEEIIAMFYKKEVQKTNQQKNQNRKINLKKLKKKMCQMERLR